MNQFFVYLVFFHIQHSVGMSRHETCSVCISLWELSCCYGYQTVAFVEAVQKPLKLPVLVKLWRSRADGHSLRDPLSQGMKINILLKDIDTLSQGSVREKHDKTCYHFVKQIFTVKDLHITIIYVLTDQ